MKNTFKKLARAALSTVAGLAMLVQTSCARSPPQQVAPKQEMRYAIIAKHATANDTEWKKPIDALEQKYPSAKTFTFTNTLDDVRAAVRAYQPTHVDYVAQPQELVIPELPHLTDARSVQEHLHVGMNSGVGQFNRFLTQLDDDPFRDAIGGIVTGATATDALKLAEARSFTINHALLKTLGEDENLAAFPHVLAYSDGRPENNRVVKREKRGSNMKKTLLDVAGPEFLEHLNSGIPQLVVTSGHANYMNWECGWNYPDTRFVVGKNAALYAVSPSGAIDGMLQSSNPKIYWGAGNCQSARIKSPQESLALSWIHSGNAVQFVGYTLDTWHGFIGWNLRHALLSSERPTVAEALTQTFIATEHERQRLEAYRQQHGLPMGDHEFGKAYDLAAVALYGNSALDVRVGGENAAPLFDKSFTAAKKGSATHYTCTLKTLRDDTYIQAPVVYRFSHPLKNPKVTKTSQGLDYALIDDAVIFNTSDLVTEQGVPQLKPRALPKNTIWTLELEARDYSRGH